MTVETENMGSDRLAAGMGAALDVAMALSDLSERIRELAKHQVVTSQLDESTIVGMETLCEGMWVAATAVLTAVANQSGLTEDLDEEAQKFFESRASLAAESLNDLSGVEEFLNLVVSVSDMEEGD